MKTARHAHGGNTLLSQSSFKNIFKMSKVYQNCSCSKRADGWGYVMSAKAWISVLPADLFY